MMLGYDTIARWHTNGYWQSTLAKSGDMGGNARAGVGGAYRVTDAFQVDAEASYGQLGPGGKLGTSYQATDHTSLYLNYGLDDERGDDGLYSRRESLTGGARARASAT